MQRFISLEEKSPLVFLLKKFINDIEIIPHTPDLHIRKEDVLITNYSSWRDNRTNNFISHNFHINDILSKYENKIILDDVTEPDQRIGEIVKKYKEYNKNVLYLSLTGGIKEKTYAPSACWFLFYFFFKHLPFLDKNYSYVSNKTFTKKFLMPIRRPTMWRKEIVKTFNEFLPEIIYSANWMGVNLPNDHLNNIESNDLYFNPYWYDSTYYSVVVESCILNITEPHLSEKTFKPINFFHPFMVICRPNHLLNLKKLGFETFENLFDETYDLEPNLEKKLNIIKDNINNYKYEKSYDNLTLEKINHNHNHFNNYNLIKKMFMDQVYTPIQNFVNSQ